MNEVRLRGFQMPLIRNIGTTHTHMGWVHPDRLVDYHVFIYVSCGRMQIVEDGTEYILNEGEAFFLKKGLHHWGGEGTLPDTVTYWIHFYDGMPGIEERAEEEQGSLKHLLLSSSYKVFSPKHYDLSFELPKRLKVKNGPYFQRKLKELADWNSSSRPYNHIYLSMGAMDVFLELYRQSKESAAHSRADVVVRRLIAYLEEHCDKELDTEQIGAELQLNYHYISTLFKAHVGTSIFKYHERLRIHHASELLKQTQLNVSEVSERVGFTSPFYFSRVFKKVMGEAPSEFIKNIYRS